MQNLDQSQPFPPVALEENGRKYAEKSLWKLPQNIGFHSIIGDRRDKHTARNCKAIPGHKINYSFRAR